MTTLTDRPGRRWRRRRSAGVVALLLVASVACGGDRGASELDRDGGLPASEVDQDQLPENRDDDVVVTGPAEVSPGSLPMEVAYTVTNAAADPDRITVRARGNVLDDAVVVHDLSADESVTVAVMLTRRPPAGMPGFVEVVATSGDDPGLTASTRTDVDLP